MASGSNIGIMDEAYFVGRKAILAWINDTFSLNVAKIEDTASGAVACQICDAVFPGSVPMSKVKWDARNDYEFVHNYKILQRVFEKKGVDKHVDVQKLVRAKYQDNLEFMQWMKRWFELNHDGSEYDGVKRRSKARSAPGKPKARPTRAAENSSAAANRHGAAARKPKAAAKAPAAAKAAAPAAKKHPAARRTTAASSDLKRQLGEANAQVAELKVSVDGLEKERDFYFGKLRDIEILLQSYSDDTGFPDSKELTQHIFKILYATEDDFVVIEGEEDSKTDSNEADVSKPAAAAAAAPETVDPVDPEAAEDLRDLSDLNLGDGISA